MRRRAGCRIDARLPLGLAQGNRGFFLEQHRKHQQGVKRHPGQRRRLVGRAPQRNVQLRRRPGQLPVRRLVLSRSNSVSSSRGTERAAWAAARSAFPDRTRSALWFCFCSCLSFRSWFWVKSENPRLTGNRGFLKKSPVRSEFQSHDAQKTGAALPNGHAAIDRRVLQHLRCERGFHLLPATRNTISAHLSKVFWWCPNL